MKIEAIRPHCYLDISIGGENIGRIVLELFSDLAPRTAENFQGIVNGRKTKDNGILTYKGNYFHRVIKNFIVQAGDLKYGMSLEGYSGNEIGTGSLLETSEQGQELENSDFSFDEPFNLCMANSESNGESSQFFITTFPEPHLKGKYSVFGRVIHGKPIVRQMERIDTDKQDRPLKEQLIRIENCGDWDENMGIPEYNSCSDQIGGDKYEEYPDDDKHIDKDAADQAFKAGNTIKESGNLLMKNGRKREAFLKYKKSLRYVMELIPDEEREPEWTRKFLDLKKKLYLNLSMVTLQLGLNDKTLDYTTYLLEMNNLSPQESAKAHYRRGISFRELKRNESALKEFRAAHNDAPQDTVINNELDKALKSIEEKKEAEKNKFAKFFK